MNNQLIKDSAQYPKLFVWNGAISPKQIQFWLQGRNLKLPKDLVELWAVTGGGDLFESETILSPFGDTHLGDDIDSVNEFHHYRGMAKKYLLFHRGTGFTAVRLTDGCYIVLNNTYQEIISYLTLEDWYLNKIRSEYAKHYGLAVSKGN